MAECGWREAAILRWDTPAMRRSIIAANLMWIRETLGEASDEWKDVLSWDGGRWAVLPLAVMDEMRRYEMVNAQNHHGSFVSVSAFVLSRSPELTHVQNFLRPPIWV